MPIDETTWLTKVLVADRGAVAVKVLDTCHDLGLRTWTIFSDADRDALHVAHADGATCLGSDDTCFTNIEAIVACALRVGADAVHPGASPIAQDAAYADACAAAGLVFLGPSGDVLRYSGDKVQAREIAELAGVPVIPGAESVVDAGRLTFPIVVKARAGRDGIGLRMVDSPDGLAAAAAAARQDAGAQLVDDRVYLEQLIPDAHHVVVTIIGDKHEDVIHVGECETTVQRHHRRLISTSPAPSLPLGMRDVLCSAAVAIGRAVGFVGVGSVEFLVGERQFYFLEVNGRLPDDYAVLEAAQGVNLVEWQLRVAMGEWTPTLDTSTSRVAIGCRVQAAKARKPRTLQALSLPEESWLTVESSVGPGHTVGPKEHIADLVAVAPDRAIAILRMDRALHDLGVLGVATNLPHLRAVAASPAFRAGGYAPHAFVAPPEPRAVPDLAIGAAAFALALRNPAWAPDAGAPVQTYRWTSGRSVSLRSLGGKRWELTVNVTSWVVRVVSSAPELILEDAHGDQHHYLTCVAGGSVWVHSDGVAYELTPKPDTDEAAATVGVCTAPVDGILIALNVAAGDRVITGDALAVILGSEGEHTLRAPTTGKVVEVFPSQGDTVTAGAMIAVLGGVG